MWAASRRCHVDAVDRSLVVARQRVQDDWNRRGDYCAPVAVLHAQVHAAYGLTAEEQRT